MTQPSAPLTARRALIRWFGIAALIACGLAAVFGDRLTSASRTATRSAPAGEAAQLQPADAVPSDGGADEPAPPEPPAVAAPSGGGLGTADGAIPAGTSVFDDAVPGVARLDAELLAAVRRAATDASREGVRFVVDSGWRSAAYQDELRRRAVAEHGSAAEAARWVASADTSLHVSGDAVDLGPRAARQWLAERGAAYGLCRVYGNEPWHFELRANAATGGCPSPYADPTHDPRLRP